MGVIGVWSDVDRADAEAPVRAHLGLSCDPARRLTTGCDSSGGPVCVLQDCSLTLVWAVVCLESRSRRHGLVDLSQSTR